MSRQKKGRQRYVLFDDADARSYSSSSRTSHGRDEESHHSYYSSTLEPRERRVDYSKTVLVLFLFVIWIGMVFPERAAQLGEGARDLHQTFISARQSSEGAEKDFNFKTVKATLRNNTNSKKDDIGESEKPDHDSPSDADGPSEMDFGEFLEKASSKEENSTDKKEGGSGMAVAVEKLGGSSEESSEGLPEESPEGLSEGLSERVPQGLPEGPSEGLPLGSIPGNETTEQSKPLQLPSLEARQRLHESLAIQQDQLLQQNGIQLVNGVPMLRMNTVNGPALVQAGPALVEQVLAPLYQQIQDIQASQTLGEMTAGPSVGYKASSEEQQGGARGNELHPDRGQTTLSFSAPEESHQQLANEGFPKGQGSNFLPPALTQATNPLLGGQFHPARGAQISTGAAPVDNRMISGGLLQAPPGFGPRQQPVDSALYTRMEQDGLVQLQQQQQQQYYLQGVPQPMTSQQRTAFEPIEQARSLRGHSAVNPQQAYAAPMQDSLTDRQELLASSYVYNNPMNQQAVHEQTGLYNQYESPQTILTQPLSAVQNAPFRGGYVESHASLGGSPHRRLTEAHGEENRGRILQASDYGGQQQMGNTIFAGQEAMAKNRAQQNQQGIRIPQQNLGQFQGTGIREQNAGQTSWAGANELPSHVKVCKTILGQGGGLFFENEQVCTDAVDFTKSMAQIFLSAYLTALGRMFGFPVEHDHHCDRYQNEQKLLFQQFLPSPLVVPQALNGDMTRDELLGLCSMIVGSMEQTGASNPLEILLWDTSTPNQRMRGLKETPELFVDQRRRLQDSYSMFGGQVGSNADQFFGPRQESSSMFGQEAGSSSQQMNEGATSQGMPRDSSVFSDQGQLNVSQQSATMGAPEPIPMLQRLMPLIQANLYKGSMNGRLVEGGFRAGYGVLKGRDATSERIANGRAVIVLPCRDHEGLDAAIVPYFSYLMHLPTSVGTVDIVQNQLCQNQATHLHQYASDLASTLRQFAPRMSVELISAVPSAPDAVARLIEAEHVLCGPGFGMVCLFPSLSRDGGRYTLFDVADGQAEGPSTSNYVSRLPPHLIAHVHPPLSNFAVAFSSTFGDQSAAMSSFAQRSPERESGDCRFVRGRVGNWVKDMNYAAQAQYRTPLVHYSGNAEKIFRKELKTGKYGDMQFRPPTTYRWDESRYQSCPMEVISQEGVCNVLQSLGARRIFLLGDSLTLQLAQSMWMWLSPDGDSPTQRGTLEPNFKYTFQCQNFGDYTVQFIRNDEFLENDQPVSIDNDQKNCATFCYPWTQEYMSDPSRTILLANVGAHIHEFPRFQAAIDRFVDVVNRMNRPQDIVLFRTLVPGHWDCGRPGLAPFQSFKEYTQDAEEHQNPKDAIYSWSKFAEYNDYAVNVIDKRRFEETEGPRALMEVVDVFPMTVLRPDGHCSDEYRPPSYLDSDCLHYDLPGPIDWWSHMAFSHIQDIAAAEGAFHG